MASHRKSRPAGTRAAGIRTPVLATAALTSVALLSQTADAAPQEDGRPSLEEVEKKVDDLYRQAESATEKYNAAKEKTAKQRANVDALLDDVARRTQKLNEAREELGSFAAAQYRTGASAPDTATFLLADSPQDYFDQSQLMGRMTSRQKSAVDDYVTEQSATTKKRQEAGQSLETLTDTQGDLQAAKATVQRKLSDAREMLSKLTSEEKARLAAAEEKRQQEAARKAAELARQQEEQRKAQEEARQEDASAGSSTTPTSPPLRARRLHVRRQGGQGARLRPRADRQALRLGCHRPRLLRLLRPHPGSLEGRRRHPPPHHLRPGRRRHHGAPFRRPAR